MRLPNNLKLIKKNINVNFEKRFELGKLLNKLKLNNIGIEIGSQKGIFAKRLISSWKHGHLIMLDLWEQTEDNVIEFTLNSNKTHLKYLKTCGELSQFYGYHRLSMMKIHSNLAATLIKDESLDFFYLDANHSYYSVEKDLKNWIPKVKKGGVLSGHDYNLNSVQLAVNVVLKKVNHVKIDNSWWCIKK